MTSATHRAAVPAALLAAGLLGGCTAGSGTGHSKDHTGKGGAGPSSASASPAAAQRALARIERRHHARLGVFMVNTGTGRTVEYRAGERFAHCSTVKALAAGVVLKRSSDGDLDRVVRYRSSDLQEYSPVTSRHVRGGMTLRQLIDAALRYSDNTAGNLLIEHSGGPRGLQSALRGLGDSTIRVDRGEPHLNDAEPGDVRDTSTPRSIGTDLRRFALGNALQHKRREVLGDVMARNTTGGPYIRAGVPAGWKVADKTGNGGHGTRNDIAVVRPRNGAPIVVAVLSDRRSADASSDDGLIRDATRAGLRAVR